MTTEIGNIYPLIVVSQSGEKALQNVSTPCLPSQNSQEHVVLNNRLELESDTLWEKGMFVDVYI